MKKYNISASLICGDQANFKDDIYHLVSAEVDMIHVDCMDGIFVPRLGMYPEQVRDVKKYMGDVQIPINVHMMSSNPEPYIKWFADSGADFITVHVEGNNQLVRTVQMIKDAGCKAGLAFNIHSFPNTYMNIIKDIDLIMLMAINPGILGQGCWEGIYDKIEQTRNWVNYYNRPDILIEIDGGVKPETAPKMIQSGANVLTCGTGTIYRPQEGSLTETITRFRNHMNKELNK